MTPPKRDERITYWQQWAEDWDGHNADGVRELVAEVRRLRETLLGDYHVAAARNRSADLAAELKDVLEYAGHKINCDAFETGIPCSCGWTAMREKWRGK